MPKMICLHLDGDTDNTIPRYTVMMMGRGHEKIKFFFQNQDSVNWNRCSIANLPTDFSV